jgi:predicted transcriptional regulator
MKDKENELAKINGILKNSTNQRIIKYLMSNGKVRYENIIRNLSLNSKTGMLHIIELKNIGVVNFNKNSTILELNVDFMRILKSEG